jgi:hypothetical protein
MELTLGGKLGKEHLCFPNFGYLKDLTTSLLQLGKKKQKQKQKKNN